METELKLQPGNLREGMKLPELKKSVTQQNINLYAQASRDFNPIHIDESFARNTPLGGTIAHGMLILAYVSELMTAAFGRSWLVSGKLNVRFRSPARPGDTIAVGGKIRRMQRTADKNSVTCDVLCQNQKGEPVITGETSVMVRDEDIG
jgi:acyl dehydratase